MQRPRARAHASNWLGVLACAAAALAQVPALANAVAPQANTYLLGEAGLLRGWSLSNLVTSERGSDDGGRPASESPTVASSVQYANASGVVDLADLLKPHHPGTDSIVAEGTLNLQQETQGWLLVKVSGSLVVSVDGKVELRREIGHAHAHGWEAIKLHLASGPHGIRLKSRFLREPWQLSARFVDDSGHAPVGSQWHLPAHAATAKSKPDPFDVAVECSVDAPAGLVVHIDAPVGTRITQTEHVTISVGSEDHKFSKDFFVGNWPPAGADLNPLQTQLGTISELLGILDGTDNTLNITVKIGGFSVTRRVHLPHAALEVWQRLAKRVAALPPVASANLDVLGASLHGAAIDLGTAMAENCSLAEIEAITKRVAWLCDAQDRQQPPWLLPGVHDLALYASADHTLQRFALHVPDSVGDNQPKPLILVLHGYNGTPRRIIDAFLDQPANATRAKVDGYVLAPAAHGNAFYRGPGERDVLEILDWALHSLGIDRTRVTITGASMGGTGTAEVAFHYPDYFAALAPLCGYHSYFVRRDITGQPLRAWERRLMHRFSPASSAAAGRHLPMYLAQGLKDKPLENSKVLTERYRKLGYSLTEDWPDVGHAVWKRTWAHAGLFPWLSKRQRADDPAHISLSFTALRHGKSHWLAVTEIDPAAEISQIDANFVAPHELTVVSKGVSAFEISPSPHAPANQPLNAHIDGIALSLPASTAWRLVREGANWKAGLPERTPLRKAVHVEGPWPDLWNERLIFVYGSTSHGTVGTNRLVAEYLASPQGGVDNQYPVVSDSVFQSMPAQDLVPVLIGTAADNSLLAKWARLLPLVVDGPSIVVGKQRFTGNHLGALYVYPNPEQPQRVIGVITAPTAEGLWQSLSLPMLLPDFVVFDDRVGTAEGQPILGRWGHVLAAGFFNADWSLPNQLTDPLDAVN